MVKKTNCNRGTRNCRNLLNKSRTKLQDETRNRIWFFCVESGECSPLQCGSLPRGSEACFCFFPAACPLYPLATHTFSLSLPPRVPPVSPLSTLIVFPSDKDLITHREDLEPEPHSERKREGQPIRNTCGEQLALGAAKAPCVSL